MPPKKDAGVAQGKRRGGAKPAPPKPKPGDGIDPDTLDVDEFDRSSHLPEDESVKCAFCRGGHRMGEYLVEALGHEDGPAQLHEHNPDGIEDINEVWASRYGLIGGENKRFFVHMHCAIHSPQAYQSGMNWIGLRKEIHRARGLKCVLCGESGAALGCGRDKCNSTYHVPCAIQAGIKLRVLDDFFCSEECADQKKAAVLQRQKEDHYAASSSAPSAPFSASADISGGRELFPIECVRSFTSKKLSKRIPSIKYTTRNLDSEDCYSRRNALRDMDCCGCDGVCDDVSVCACLIAAGGRNYIDGKLMPNLDRNILVECNARCSCSIRRCTNRIVERGPTHNLQLFRVDSASSGAALDTAISTTAIGATAGDEVHPLSSAFATAELGIIHNNNSNSNSRNSSSIQTRKSRREKWGVRTLSAIKANEFVCEVTGQYLYGRSVLPQRSVQDPSSIKQHQKGRKSTTSQTVTETLLVRGFHQTLPPPFSPSFSPSFSTSSSSSLLSSSTIDNHGQAKSTTTATTTKTTTIRTTTAIAATTAVDGPERGVPRTHTMHPGFFDRRETDLDGIIPVFMWPPLVSEAASAEARKHEARALAGAPDAQRRLSAMAVAAEGWRYYDSVAEWARVTLACEEAMSIAAEMLGEGGGIGETEKKEQQQQQPDSDRTTTIATTTTISAGKMSQAEFRQREAERAQQKQQQQGKRPRMLDAAGEEEEVDSEAAALSNERIAEIVAYRSRLLSKCIERGAASLEGGQQQEEEEGGEQEMVGKKRSLFVGDHFNAPSATKQPHQTGAAGSEIRNGGKEVAGGDMLMGMDIDVEVYSELMQNYLEERRAVAAFLNKQLCIDSRYFGNVGAFIRPISAVYGPHINSSSSSQSSGSSSSSSRDDFTPAIGLGSRVMLKRRLVYVEKNRVLFPKLALFAAVDIPANTELLL